MIRVREVLHPDARAVVDRLAARGFEVHTVRCASRLTMLALRESERFSASGSMVDAPMVARELLRLAERTA